MQIHIHAEGQRLGPFSIDEINERLRQGSLSADGTLAWHAGCPNWIALKDVPGLTPALQAHPPPLPAPPPLPPLPANQGDATGGLIPYKNPHALISYYLGIVGLIPAIGLIFAAAAIILGVLGLKKRTLNPVIKGAVHAWIGIVLGLVSIAYHILTIVVIVSLR